MKKHTFLCMQRSEKDVKTNTTCAVASSLIHSFPFDYMYSLVIMCVSPIVNFTLIFVLFNMLYIGLINSLKLCFYTSK